MSGSRLQQIEAAEVQHLGLYGGEVARFGAVQAVAAGPGLPVSVASGFGQTISGLEQVEAFYARRKLPSKLVVYSHFAEWAALAERGYRLTQLLHVHWRPLEDLPEWTGRTVRASPPAEFAALSARAFGPGNEAIMERTARREQTRLFAAEVAGEPVAAGAMSVFGAVAWLFSAATLPDFRGLGAQVALLAARLHAAKEMGASQAAVLATPGSVSERNVQRAGFVQVGARLSLERA